MSIMVSTPMEKESVSGYCYLCGNKTKFEKMKVTYVNEKLAYLDEKIMYSKLVFICEDCFNIKDIIE
jgi:hypothetical protein